MFSLVVPNPLSQQLLTFHLKARKWLGRFMFIVWAEAFAYWNASLWLKNSHSLRDVLLKVYVPFFSLYSVSGICFMPFYFLMDVHYCRIKQQNYLLKVSGNVKDLSNLLGKSNVSVNFTQKCTAVKQTFRKHFYCVLVHFKEVFELDNYWRPLMSVEFIGYIAMICYLLNGFLTDTSVFELGQRSFFVFLPLNFLFLLLLLPTNVLKL